MPTSVPPPNRDLGLAPKTRRILHLDVDAFLTSVECALHPELRGKPLVVGGMPDERNLVKRIGIELSNFSPARGWQTTLFSDPASDRLPGDQGPRGSHADRQRRLDGAVDELRARFGFGRLLRGSSLPLSETHELGPEGYRLRTPSLNQ